jgi:hypothetical protein
MLAVARTEKLFVYHYARRAPALPLPKPLAITNLPFNLKYAICNLNWVAGEARAVYSVVLKLC